jgi:hypothetical protein
VSADHLGGVLFMSAGGVMICAGGLYAVIYGLDEAVIALLAIGMVSVLVGLALFVTTW